MSSASRDTSFDVALLTPEFLDLSFGGVGTYVTRLVGELMARGQRVLVLLPFPGALPAAQHLTDLGGGSLLLRIPVEEVVYRSAAAAHQLATRAVSETKRRALTFRCLHAHEFPCFEAGLALKRATGAPLVVTFHQLELHRDIATSLGDVLDRHFSAAQRRSLELRALRGADHFVCISDDMRGRIQRRLPRGGRGRATRLYFPFEPAPPVSRARASALRARFAGREEKLVVFAGRAHAQKGAAPLLRAATALLLKRRDFRLLVVGGDDLKAAVRESIPFDARGRLALLPFCEREHLLELFQASDVGVVPSLYEPFGIVALEMIAAGLPLVHSDVDGLRELGALARRAGHRTYPVRVKDRGARHRALDEASLQRRLDEALSAVRPGGRKRRVEPARFAAFSEDTFAEGHLALYERLYAARASNARR